MTVLTRNEALFDKIAAQIEETPDRWDQYWFVNRTYCGTSHCIAGWAVALSGPADYDTHTADQAAELLGLTEEEADLLFYSGFAFSREPGSATEMADALRAIGRGADVPSTLPTRWYTI